LEIVMTMNSKNRATKLMAGLIAAALTGGCAHHAAPATIEAMAPDTVATPAPTADATPATVTPAVADATPTTTPAVTEAAAPATAPAVQEASAVATVSQPPVVPAQTDVPENNPHGERYDAEDAARSTGLFAQSQAASGAKADAMLYDRNFDGSALNSLGQVKLDLILKATAGGQPVVIYLNVPHDGITDRQVAVTAYLKNAGVPDQLVKLVEGSNPSSSTPSGYNLATIYKVDSQTYTGEAADEQVVTGGTPPSGK
jgi:hypothetical protein